MVEVFWIEGEGLDDLDGAILLMTCAFHVIDPIQDAGQYNMKLFVGFRP